MGGVTKGIKLVVVGDSVREKGGGLTTTTLLLSYVNGRYPEDHVRTVFDNYTVALMAGQDPIELGLWDTRGQEEYARLRPLSYANANVFLLLFSVVDPESYRSVSLKWVPELVHFCPNLPIILVGCQTELRSDEKTLGGLRKQGQQPITYEQGQDLAAQIRAVRYMECSARTGNNVSEVFSAAVKAVLFNTRGKINLESLIPSYIYRMRQQRLFDESMKREEQGKSSRLYTTRRQLQRNLIAPPPTPAIIPF